jgi:hypothetical protein
LQGATQRQEANGTGFEKLAHRLSFLALGHRRKAAQSDTKTGRAALPELSNKPYLRQSQL